MSDMDMMTVRDFLDILDAVRPCIAAADAVTTCLGNEEWQEMFTVAEFRWIMVSTIHPFGATIRLAAERAAQDAMAKTLRQIEALPDTP